jgi:hypothetical protein
MFSYANAVTNNANANAKEPQNLENSIMSLYIPHVFENITKEEIIETFESQSLGRIKSIDFISKLGKNNVAYNAAYLHFDYWFNNTASNNFQEKLKNPEKECRVIYDDPWFWLVLENKTQKHLPNERKPRLALQDLTQQLKSVLSINIDTAKSNQEFAQLYPPQIKTPCPTELPKKSYASLLKTQTQPQEKEEEQTPEFDLFANIEKIKQIQQDQDLAFVEKAHQEYLDIVEFEQLEAEHQKMLEEDFDTEVEEDWNNQQELIQNDCLEAEELEEEQTELVDANYVCHLEEENYRLRCEIADLLALHQTYVRNYSR